MSTPYELLVRFEKDGTVAGCHVRTISTVNGKDYESDPVPLADAIDPAFTQFAASFSASVVAERDALVIKKAKLTTDLASMTTSRDVLTKTLADTQDANTTNLVTINLNHNKIVDELKANHSQVILAKDADLAATKLDLGDKRIFIQELDFKVKTLNELIVAKDTEIARLKAASNPPIPTPVIGETKTVSITVDATAWDGILASIYDPTIDIPAERQATDFILNQYAAKFVAWAEKANFVAVDEQANAAKEQIKEVTKARAIEVLSSTKVKIT